MSSIGYSTLEIIPSLKGFDSKLKAQMKTVGQTSGNQVAAGMHSSLASKARTVFAPLLAAGAAYKLAGFVRDATAGYREHLKVVALTNQVIKTTGGVAGLTSKQVEGLSNAIELKTGVDGDAIQSGANLLLTFKNIHNETGKGNAIFNRATRAVTDMSVALGQDMKSGSIQLGKALNDPIKGITALSRVGVSFTDQQKAQIQTMVDSGNTMSAQKVILKELSSEFGGAAVAAATPADKALAAYHRLQDEVGKVTVPIMDRLYSVFSDKIAPVLIRMAANIGKLDFTQVGKSLKDVDFAQLGASFLQLGQGLKQSASDLPSFVDTMNLTAAVVRFAAKHVDLLVKALPFLAAGFLVVKTAQLASNAAAAIAIPVRIAEVVAVRAQTNAMRALTPALSAQTAALSGSTLAEGANTSAKRSGIFAAVRSRLATIGKAVAERVAAAASKAMAAAQWLVNAAMTANPIGLVVVGLAALVTGLVIAYKKSDAFRAIVNKAFKAIKDVAAPVLHWLGEAVASTVDFVRDHWKTFAAVTLFEFTLVKGIVKRVFGAVADIVRGVLRIVKGVVDTAMGVIHGNWADAWDGIKEILRGAWDVIKGVVKLGTAVIRGILAAAWGLIKGGVSKAWDGITNVIGDAWTGIKGKARDGVDALKGLLSDTWDSIESKASNAWGRIAKAIGDAFKKVQGWVKAPIQWVITHVLNDGLIGAFNWVVDNAKLPTDLRIGDIDIPGFHAARGAVVPGYTPGRDTTLAAVSGGEAIMRPEWTRAVGEDNINAMNRTAREGGVDAVKRALDKSHKYLGGYFLGGVLPLPGATSIVQHSPSDYPWATWAGDFNRGSGYDDYGALISAFKDGVVASTIGMGDNSYGNVTRINHKGEQTLYAHQSAFLVAAGDIVKAGQAIGKVGDLGNTGTPPTSHLHFELKGGSSAISGDTGLAPAMGAGVNGSSGLLSLPKAVLGAISDPKKFLTDKISGVLSDPILDGPLGDILKAMPGRLIGGMVDKVKSLAGNLLPSGSDAFTPYNGGGVKQWTGTVQNVLKELNQPASTDFTNRILNQMSNESGGDPNIVNKTDSNWVAGHPSVGLMQVIEGTYNAYAGKYRSGGAPFLYGVGTNPFANVYAAVNYGMSRYGSVPGAFHPPYAGYDGGGVLKPGWTAAWNGTGKVETVRTLEQEQRLQGNSQALEAKLDAILTELQTLRKTGSPVTNAADIGKATERVSRRQIGANETFRQTVGAM